MKRSSVCWKLCNTLTVAVLACGGDDGDRPAPAAAGNAGEAGSSGTAVAGAGGGGGTGGTGAGAGGTASAPPAPERTPIDPVSREADAGLIDGGTPGSGSDDSGPETICDEGEICDIVADTVTLAEGGSCLLTQEQQAPYMLVGFDCVSCIAGRVSAGGFTASELTLNGLVLRCGGN